MELSRIDRQEMDKNIEVALGFMAEDLLDLLNTGKYTVSVEVDGERQRGIDILKLLEAAIRRAVTKDAKDGDSKLLHACAILIAKTMESQASVNNIDLAMHGRWMPNED